MRTALVIILFLLLLPAAVPAAEDLPYPFADPYRATVLGTPAKLRYRFEDPVRPDVRAIRIEGRQVPEVFSYSRDMFFTTALQNHPAPLMFVIAGTGAEHNSGKMAFLTQVFHEAGYHVAALSSPTHMNFVISASEHRVPGYVPFDVADLDRVMGWVREELAKECEITGYSVAGYSLGGLHAAFLAKRDDETHEFGFKHVLMINPPVSLYRSVTRLDSWVTGENLGRTTVHQEIEKFIDRFSDYYLHAEVTDLDDDFMYDMITDFHLDERDLKTLIGAAFRVSSASMIFSSDVCLRAEYLVPPSHYPLETSSPLLPYARQAFDIPFQGYLDEYLLPYLRYNDPTVTRAGALWRSSLESIRDWLEKADKVEVVGTRDDVILDAQDLRFLETVFGDRAHLFEHGGHCGNMMHPAFVRAMKDLVRP
ncbi:Alpha/beta hydrolase family protein [Pseudodesulfovibrio hydrargyri]|uniref:Alpha/beta hydrolase family protein n=1 Tax=Pseudodesulfovibrio hydrargyri TaxID=2125990 RepID=A0A1J5MTN0_9BACT|nr:alpha/beta fold hydrolase [Pseudodesulfovibrio hydrargyri]OIQ49362.1 Alpha/beta hydrolase family protein [Pseudodesulfovibrio hydrargyri]